MGGGMTGLWGERDREREEGRKGGREEGRKRRKDCTLRIPTTSSALRMKEAATKSTPYTKQVYIHMRT